MKNSHKNPFKDKLEHFAPAVNKEELWDAVKHYTPQRKRRPWIIPLLVFGILASIALSTYAIILLKKQESQSAFVNIEVNSNTTPSSPINSSSQERIEVDKDGLVKRRSQELADESSLQQDKIVADFATTDNRLGDKTNSTSRKHEIPNHHSNKRSYAVIGATNNEADHSTYRAIRKYSTYKHSVLKTLPFSDLDLIKRSNLNDLTARNPSLSAYPGMAAIGNLELKTLSYPLDADLPLIKAQRQNQRYWKIGVEAGLSMLNMTDLRSSVTPMDWKNSFQSNIRLHMGLDSKLEVFSGLNYTMFSYQMDYNNTYTESREVSGAQTVIINERGEERIINGNINERSIVNHSGQFYSYLDVIDVPIGLQYNFFPERRLNASLNGGIALNIFRFSSGSTVDEEGRLYQWNRDSASPFTRFKPNYFVGLGLNYKIRPSIELSASLNASYRKIDYRLGSQEHTFEAWHTGAQLGVFFRL